MLKRGDDNMRMKLVKFAYNIKKLLIFFLYSLLIMIVLYFGYKLLVRYIYIPIRYNYSIYNDTNMRGSVWKEIDIDTTYKMMFYLNYNDYINVFRENKKTNEQFYIYQLFNYKRNIIIDTTNKPSIKLLVEFSSSHKDSSLYEIILNPYVQKFIWDDTLTNISLYR